MRAYGLAEAYMTVSVLADGKEFLYEFPANEMAVSQLYSFREVKRVLVPILKRNYFSSGRPAKCLFPSLQRTVTWVREV